jgi:hypothetical protein
VRAMSSRTSTRSWIVSTAVAFCTVLIHCTLARAGQEPAPAFVSRSSEDTLFVNCTENEKPKRVLSPVALSEDEKWSAYVEVDVQGKHGCLHTSRLWVAKGNSPYRLLYLIPPKRDNVENGMKVLGWAPGSRMVLVQTEQWQYGSDAPDSQQILAIDTETGEVYEPRLESLLQNRDGKQCAFRITDAGFSSDKNVVILVRANIFTALEPDESEADLPVAKRCTNREETWSFNYATGETKLSGSGEPLHLFRKFLPNPAK